MRLLIGKTTKHYHSGGRDQYWLFNNERDTAVEIDYGPLFTAGLIMVPRQLVMGWSNVEKNVEPFGAIQLDAPTCKGVRRAIDSCTAGDVIGVEDKKKKGNWQYMLYLRKENGKKVKHPHLCIDFSDGDFQSYTDGDVYYFGCIASIEYIDKPTKKVKNDQVSDWSVT